MKKKTYLLGMAVLVAGLLALSGVAQSAMWAGVELGGNFVPSTKLSVAGIDVNNTSFHPAVIGGGTLGYDFVNAGFGGYAWPDWMKYFSVATDFTYNRLNMSSLGNIAGGSRENGYVAAWTFLLMAHYGFLPDSEVPSGRINPYIGVGPAIVFSGINFSLPVPYSALPQAKYLGVGINSRFGTSATNVALVVEPGIRWVCLKNVSIDTAFRWRYCVPAYDFDNATVKVNPLNQLSFLVRANYHF
ncbi:MAG: hypothetical protein WBV23_11295 [Desulfobaccales bacterium]